MNGENKDWELENDNKETESNASLHEQTEQSNIAETNVSNQETTQIPVTEPAQTGYTVTAQQQMNNGYNFWQHQAGGSYYENPSQNS